MGAEKDRKALLSQIAADLLAGSKESGEPLNIYRFRGEIEKALGTTEEVFWKFRGIVESFRDILPDEKQRFEAAIKAMGATAGLGQEDVLKAADNQLDEIKVLEQELISALGSRRDELKAMEARTREVRKEISRLREVINRLEREEQDLLGGISAREEEAKLAEKGLKDLFKEIGEEITGIKHKIVGFAAEKVAPRPIVIKSNKHEEETKGGKQAGKVTEPPAIETKNKPEEESSILETPPPPARKKGERECPMCGGGMSYFLKEKKWQCYSCAHEDTQQGDFQDKSEPASPPEPAPKASPESVPASETPATRPATIVEYDNSHFSPSSDVVHSGSVHVHPQRSSGKKKLCPVCKKKMDWYEDGKTWHCPYCKYERMDFNG